MSRASFSVIFKYLGQLASHQSRTWTKRNGVGLSIHSRYKVYTWAPIKTVAARWKDGVLHARYPRRTLGNTLYETCFRPR